MFGQKLTGALAAFGHEDRTFRVEEHDSFRSERTGLCGAE
jgi:hypothetical protein